MRKVSCLDILRTVWEEESPTYGQAFRGIRTIEDCCSWCKNDTKNDYRSDDVFCERLQEEPEQILFITDEDILADEYTMMANRHGYETANLWLAKQS